MDEIGSDGRLRHDVPMHVAKRLFIGLAGLFCIIVPTWELYRGVWPPNFASPFFLFIILGAYAVGIPLALAALFSPAVRWIVGTGRIDIVTRNPFFLRRYRLGPGDIADFRLRRIEWDSGGPTFSVVLTTLKGERFETRDFGTAATAEMFRDRISSVFLGKAAS
ncbi:MULTISPECIES: hypothetical protein [Mesorhizobium]|uniref:PH domain-containing protein n=2 Tax=Mesorhizobium TaxID=68287 RepID=A0ABU5ASM5_9HYPH|nr:MULTISPECIES: hypothetical protein [Mesorhizobium]RVC59242.1 hypothetical protein EN779_16675 [Mesorhizobium sp. M4B.F.Ca.ET.088.02.2.1]MDX8540295.1 hypothetical protein [Mesorhizobium abyssinicae]RVD31540.1 hypothetical protein EN738_01195 [Mesorhizobium sp. M4B.F.Ca.ET.017.02.2.1]RWA62254.1 MAG: hypothetical protein EOQ27_16375 [Mesorhizobium sp.]RWF29801.1 MAG: hypothetical protein EOS45_17230 [Mesorhizobium sp.]